MSIFGAIKILPDLEKAVLDTINLWWETYVKELELQHVIPVGSLPRPSAFLIASQLDHDSDVPLPSITVVSPGMGSKKPVQEGDGTFRTFWHVGVTCFVSTNDRANTSRMLRIYTAICRTILLQKQALGGFADGTEWLDESYDDAFNFTDSQTVQAGQVIFEVEVAGIVDRYGGPAQYKGVDVPPDPGTQPGSTWPLADTVIATVEVKE